jgi:hypothetical protein
LIFTNQPNKQTKTDKYMNESYEQVFLDIISLSLSLSLSHFGQKLQLSFFLSFYFNQFFQVDSFITSSFLVAAAVAGASSLFFILYFFILFLSNFLF